MNNFYSTKGESENSASRTFTLKTDIEVHRVKRVGVFWLSANVFGARSNLGSAQLQSADAYFNMHPMLRFEAGNVFCGSSILPVGTKSTNTVSSDGQVEDLVSSVCLKSQQQNQPWTSPKVCGQTGVS